jgi:hypothetical protein
VLGGGCDDAADAVAAGGRGVLTFLI